MSVLSSCLLFWGSILPPGNSYARTSPQDSLERAVLHQEGREQIQSLHVLLRFLHHHSSANTAQDMANWARFGFTLPVELNAPDSILLFFHLGLSSERRGRNADALDSYFEAEALLSQLQLKKPNLFDEHFFRVYYGIVRMYLLQEAYPIAMEYLDFMVAKADTMERIEALATLRSYQGMCAEGMEEFEQAIFFFTESMRLFASRGLDVEKWRNQKNLAQAYLAFEEAERARELLDSLPSFEHSSIDYLLLKGQYHRTVASLDSAIWYQKRAAGLAIEQGDVLWQVDALYECGLSRMQAGQLTEAMHDLKLGLSLVDQYDLEQQREATAYALEQLFDEMGQIDSSLHYARMARKAVQEKVLIYQQAQLKASLHLQRLNDQVNELARYQREANNQKRLRNLWLIGGIILGLLILGFGIMRERYLRQQRLTAQRLASLNENLNHFTKATSHDLKEPIRMVHSFSQLLQRDQQTSLSENGTVFLDHIVEGTERLHHLVSGMAAYHQIEQLAQEVSTVDMDETLLRVLEQLHEEIEACRAVLHLEPLPKVQAHPDLMQQLLFHLIQNALKFRSAKRIPSISIRSTSQTTLLITDNGIGIPLAYQEKVFGMFQRLHQRDEYPGSGIGLALCKKIVLQYGGEIALHSLPGNGTEVRIRLNA